MIRGALAMVLLLFAAAPAAGQPLQPTLERVVSAWQRADAGAITALSARAGIAFDTHGGKTGPLPARQGTAVLRRVFEDRESVSTRTIMSRQLAGDADRAFAEVSWSYRVRGTTIPERDTVFIGFIRENNAWRVTEIRLLR